MWKTGLLILGSLLLAEGQLTKRCVQRSFGYEKIVCVCNATYCDETPEPIPSVAPDGAFYRYLSTKDGQRLNLEKRLFGTTNSVSSVLLTIDTNTRYQKIKGFGGAFTDSTGIALKQLSEQTQKQVIKAYFNPVAGSGYTLGRVPVGGTDFSTRPYTYDDHENDYTLQYFSLQPEDYQYKIPYIQQALEENPQLEIFGATWSPPAWMKTNDKINGHGFLRKECYQTYVDYLLKFLDEYKKHGIDFWALSTGNEPINAYIPFDSLNSMGWTASTLDDWVGNFFGPSLKSSIHRNTTILALDDQRFFLPWFIQSIFADGNAKQYMSGIAVHWYGDFIAPPELLDETHNQFPDKFILMTEACIDMSQTGSLLAKKVDIGSWERGEKYMLSIIDYMNHWSVGWVDWNLVLDREGGPNWINNNVDAPIIINPETDEFFKQPMYYALKHFSRFVVKDSVRVAITDTFDVKSTAFVTPSNEVVIVLYNKNVLTQTVTITDTVKGSLTVSLPGHSMSTITYSL